MARKSRFSRRIGAVLRGVLTWPIVGILSVCGVRFAIVSNPGRIGHMAAEIDAFLKERELGLIPHETPILLLDRKRAGNTELLDIFKSYMTVADRPWQRRLLAELVKIPALRLPLGRPILGFGECARYAQILALWGDRPPAISLPDSISARGTACLMEMGVPTDAWFVCLHVREGGYSPGDESSHAHRNADILNYLSAIEAITARGGWVIRVGDPTMSPLPELSNVVDYALSDHKSEWMDLWLCARNRFFLGTSSGLSMVATMFQRPCALTNMIPHGASLGMSPDDVSIPKKVIGKDGAVMPLAEIFATGLSLQRFAYVFDEHGVQIVENTPDEIRALTVEMLTRLEDDFATTEDDEDLQRRYRAHLTPCDYAYGSLGRIGRDWLRENHELI